MTVGIAACGQSNVPQASTVSDPSLADSGTRGGSTLTATTTTMLNLATAPTSSTALSSSSTTPATGSPISANIRAIPRISNLEISQWSSSFLPFVGVPQACGPATEALARLPQSIRTELGMVLIDRISDDLRGIAFIPSWSSGLPDITGDSIVGMVAGTSPRLLSRDDWIHLRSAQSPAETLSTTLIVKDGIVISCEARYIGSGE